MTELLTGEIGHDPALALQFQGVLAAAGVEFNVDEMPDMRVPLIPGETTVGEPLVPYGCYDPRGEGETSPPPPPAIN
jgi:hypothetical protein